LPVISVETVTAANATLPALDWRMLPVMAAAQPVNQSDTPKLRRWVTVAGILLIALIIFADSYEAWQDYRAATGENDSRQLELSRALSEQTTRLLQEVDLVLADYSSWMVSPEGRVARPEERSKQLRDEIKRLPFIHSATFANAAGDIVASTRDESVGTRSLKTRESFVAAQSGQGNALHIGRPFVGRTDGSVTFTLSRRVSDAHDGFAGVAVARVAFEYLVSFYSGVDITPDTLIRLEREDGVVLAQYPRSDEVIADNFYIKKTYANLVQAKEELHHEKQSGGMRQVVAFQKVDGYPAVIEVARSSASVLQPWMQRELASAARTLTLSVLAGLLLLAFRSALSRRDQLEAERKRLEEELENAQRAEALGFLAASMAHDFNNVLTAIVGYAELAHDTLAPGSPALGNIERLLAAGERARLLVRKVLTFNPRRSVSYQALPLRPIVEEVMHQLQPTLSRSVALEVQGLELNPEIAGDATEVHQVVMNLCSNAIHAMPMGGTLNISLTARVVTEVSLATVGRLGPGEWVCLRISDTGIGLAEDRLRWIFEPFYTTRQPGKGTGIGLAVVRNIVTRMNGAIEVTSQPGAGTAMSVYWPRSTAAPIQAMPNPTPPRGAGRGETVLIVDDEPELVALAEELIASLGYEPVGFADARAGLAAFQHDPERYDIVLTDERMPILRGVELARSIHEINPDVPVIVMTGHRDSDLEQLALRAGVAEVLDKPLRAQLLQHALERWLARRPSATVETAKARQPAAR
jgi:signal transduction histidine kinase/CheY-like chemotaxis protein